MGVTEVLEDSKADVFKTWDRVKTVTGGLQGTVLKSTGAYTIVVLDGPDNCGSTHEFLQSEIQKIEGRPNPLKFEDLIVTGYNFNMTVFDIILEDKTYVEWCYKKEKKFFEVSAPHRQFGYWEVEYVVPRF